MTEPAVVSRHMLVAWIAAAVLTFLVSLFLMLHSDDGATVGPSTFSVSAIGHAGIADLLQHHGDTVIKSRGNSLHRLGKDGLLVLAEPQLTLPLDQAQQALLRAPTLLLVLPKWQGDLDDRHAGWVRLVAPVPLYLPQSVLGIALHGGTVVRPDTDVMWDHNELGVAPHLTAPVQLVKWPRLRPIVGSDVGMLVGELRRGRQRVWVVSDPDVIDNHGLGEGNAAFVLALFDRLRPGGTIVFDETVHGFTSVPGNPLALLLRRPFSEVGMQLLLALALLLWAGMARFGAPESAQPPLKAGKQDLVRNVAELFRYAGHQPVLLRRYVEETVRDVARSLHAPRALNEAETLHWLQLVGRTRGIAVDCADISARAAALPTMRHRRAAEDLGLPFEIWRWKQEMMHGAASSAGNRRSDSGGSPQGRGGPG